MDKGLVAKVHITVAAPLAKVWDALTSPAMIKRYMFGTDVVSDWQEGSPIVWKGVWEGKPYEDKGVILKIEPEKTFQCTHFSPLTGKPDAPENYHTLTYTLSEGGEGTAITLLKDNNANEKAQAHSQHMWETLLESLKKVLEG